MVEDLTFTFEARKFNDEERKSYGIFISHSNNKDDLEKYVNPLAEKMEKAGIEPVFDRRFLEQGDDFRKKIFKYIHCYAAIIVISKNSIGSDWVNYEFGRCSGQRMPIFIYDPECVLNDDNDIPTDLMQHINQMLPACNSIEELFARIENTSIYSDIFEYESVDCTMDEFWESCGDELVPTMVTVESKVFDTNPTLFKRAKIGIILVNFGQSKMPIETTCPCCNEPTVCEECPLYGGRCSLKQIMQIDKSNVECISLNKMIWNGKVFFEGDANPYIKSKDATFLKSCIKFHLPVHKQYGTEFKIILEMPTEEEKFQMLDVFTGTEFIASVSPRGDTRVYVSMAPRPEKGMFRIEDPFKNNFLCKHSISEADFNDIFSD